MRVRRKPRNSSIDASVLDPSNVGTGKGVADGTLVVMEDGCRDTQITQITRGFERLTRSRVRAI
jgi:hypothetical protein